MRRYFSNIDIAQIDIGETVRYYIEGWLVFPEDEVDFTIQVMADGNKDIPYEITFRERKDVQEVLRLNKYVDKPGFSIYINDIREVLNTYKTIDIFVYANGEKQLVFHKNMEDIRKECGEKFIVYNIERLDLFGKQVVIQGWCVDVWNYEEVDVHIFDDKEQELKFRMERILRVDVNKSYGITDNAYRSGMNISLFRDSFDSSVLKLRLGNGSSYQEYVVDMEKFDAEFSKIGRLKKILSQKEKNKQYIQKNGWKAFVDHLKFEMDPSYAEYNMWLKMHSVTSVQLREQSKDRFSYEPLISIIIPLYNTPLHFLRELMDSLVKQSYKKIEICLADGSTSPEVGRFIQKKYGKDSRVRYKKLKKNRGISENTNEALAMASGEYIMLSDHDDIVTRDAVYEIVKAINKNPQTVDIVYTDEDKITMEGKNYFEPNFKPDFSWDYLRSSNYICHIFVVRKSIMDKIGGFRSKYDGAQDFDLILRCCEQAKDILHVPKVLYHWRSHPASTAENPESKMYAYEAGKKALEKHYERTGIAADVSMTKIFGRYRTTYHLQKEDLISVIIPNKDHIDDLKLCLDSMYERTSYKNFEVIIVENNSTEKETFVYYEQIQMKYKNLRMITWKDEFNYAAINNYAVKEANGNYLLFLNNDVEILSENWMEEMLGYCQREDVGAVGARLYFPDDTIQHAGVIIGMGGIAGHIFSGTPRVEYGYQARLVSAQNLSAVTAACMMVKKSVFDAVDGFDETYKVAFNDVDLCMKIRTLNKLIVYTPYAELYHYESKSRGSEDTIEKQSRFIGEVKNFENKWGDILEKGDPYYNPNMSLESGNCELRWEKKK